MKNLAVTSNKNGSFYKCDIWLQSQRQTETEQINHNYPYISKFRYPNLNSILISYWQRKIVDMK